MQKNEGGYIVVETTFSFMLFCVVMISILALINVAAIQTRTHYAITQAANELSMYCYVIDALGLSDEIKGLDETGQQVQEAIDSIQADLNAIESGITTAPSDATEFFDNLETVTDAVKSLKDTGGKVIENPKQTFIDVVRYGLDKAKNDVLQDLVIRPMVGKYLRSGTQDADSYLKGLGVSEGLNGLSFTGSTFIDDNGDITVVVSYNIDYAFELLELPFDGIQVTQTAKTKAWLGGVESGG